MSYSIKEIYYTLQGEGVHTGRPAIFVRFAGCNLWSGYEEDRTDAVCKFCDTDFVGTDGPNGGVFAYAANVTSKARQLWPEISNSRPFVVCTGGEPLLQLDQTLVNAFHEARFEVAIETNGTIEAPNGIDWICVSPKAGANLALKKGNELKLVYPQEGISPSGYENLEFEYFLLQPMDGPELKANTRKSIDFCLEHPRWGLSLQTHKILNIP
ncbi:MAG: 7-carboxy-7-deazaguanine synthase [Chloroflexi bacterium]|nr:7-carboxy-7-deazaguanine synthase [Chloroflexota bacterium]